MANFRGGPRMRKHWLPLQGAVSAITGSSTVLFGTQSPQDAFTVLRMLGSYIIGPTASVVALDAVTIGMGIAVVSTDAAVLGSSAMPDPIGEPEYPWLYWAEHDFYFTRAGGVTNTSTLPGIGGELRQSFDIRSMRKIKPQESLVFVVEYANIAGNPGMRVATSATRVLVAH